MHQAWRVVGRPRALTLLATTSLVAQVAGIATSAQAQSLITTTQTITNPAGPGMEGAQ